MRQYFIFLTISLYSFFCFSQDNNPLVKKDANSQNKWVDSLYKKMTLWVDWMANDCPSYVVYHGVNSR